MKPSQFIKRLAVMGLLMAARPPPMFPPEIGCLQDIRFLPTHVRKDRACPVSTHPNFILYHF